MFHRILLASLLSLAPLAAAPTPDQKVTYKTVGDVTLRLHVFNPENHKATDKTPAIVFFFGGGWVGGSPSQFYPHCKHLAEKGMVAISAEYRVKGAHGTSPIECVKDGNSAIRWVRQHAAELGVDPDKIAAGGGSAGGHVAAATAHTPDYEEKGEDLAISSRPNALVLFNPVLDNGPGDWGHATVKDYWKEFSPAHNVQEGAPPAIVFLGTKDPLIPVATLQRYEAAMKKAGSRCDLHLYEGQSHGFFNQSKSKGLYYEKTVTEMDAFLKSLAFLR
ncbi:MAG: alpha/beta hydrolase [Verrucomicrobia bacterium]|nr:alpha/beta hydrolase [Verrucomicrobiota bacterium]